MTDLDDKAPSTDEMTPYVRRSEFDPDGPMLKLRVTLNGDRIEDADLLQCTCGAHHDVLRTSYGFRSQCETYGVRWTSITTEDDEISGMRSRSWVAEPYITMSGRSTRNEGTEET